MTQRRRPRSSRGAEGFTLIEVVVATTIMAVVLAALVPVFVTSLGAVTQGRTRTAADSLAVRQTEALKAFRYGNLGFYEDQTDQTHAAVCASYGTNPVDLGPTTPAGPSVTPSYTTTINGQAYTVVSCVTWVDASTGSFSKAYKRTDVIVIWQGRTGKRSIVQQSAVYPGGGPAYPSGGSGQYEFDTATTIPAPAGAPGAPTGVTAADEGGTTAPSAIDVTWTPPSSSPPVDHYLVEFNTSESFTPGEYAAVSVPSATTLWTASGLAPGVTYYFQVVSVAANGTASTASTPMATATTASLNEGCTISGLTLSPNPAVVESNGNLKGGGGVTVSAEVSSACSGTLQVQYQTGTGAQTATLTGALVGGGAGQWDGVAGTSSTVWAVGSDPFTVLLNGSPYESLEVPLQVQQCNSALSGGQLAC